jgi:hypothetical protein
MVGDTASVASHPANMFVIGQTDSWLWVILLAANVSVAAVLAAVVPGCFFAPLWRLNSLWFHQPGMSLCVSVCLLWLSV